MKFVDQAEITVKAGDGGNGAVSFRREKFVPMGGPDGGDGGKGGDVVLRVDSSMSTLLDFKYQPHYKAKRGGHGGDADKTGKNASNLYIKVPPGTQVYNLETGDLLADLVGAEDSYVAARGGRGGRGNTFFKSSTNQAPRKAQPGEPGEGRSLRLELKLIADVGLVGLPNAGKSTLISVISQARPKIADYPFTTLVPNLGVVKAGAKRSFVVADLPGLIAGASQGHGLGHQFLRHVERTRVILHLVDSTSEDPEAEVEVVEAELEAFDPSLLERPRLVVLTKADIVGGVEAAAEPRDRLVKKGYEVFVISAVAGWGIEALIRATWRLVDRGRDKERQKEEWEP